jgi:type I restriction enzyme M protein
VFGVAAARIVTKKRADAPAIARVARAHPALGIVTLRDANDALLARVDALLAPALLGDASLPALDAVFESLVPRLAKGDKGQFFTPRPVVDLVVRALAPRRREVVVDPACGSGAFLTHARSFAKGVVTFGSDVDPRAVRVARLVALSQGRDVASIVRGDGLRGTSLPTADVVATNPPFAGRADAEGFAVAALVRTPERDVLFLERALDLLRPGGRLGIVLPYNKAAGAAFAALRRWLHGRARIFAVVALPRESFLPHTSQRTFVLFATRRREGEAATPGERALFAISERAGKDAAGDAITRADGALDHDLDEVLGKLTHFLDEEGFAS